ncbi:hypothetical protein [Deinococcus multiflagellatus]|uniref:ParB/Sulfiredoxin domain-containing protein n=1 Tax=Deinococcus multiflagellatus TaxID=1656887 RepID=A0ABW1ZIB5_9DEIO|nr:hypothetical protein [Deinococcus multiflagellatus]MBZ9713732.1 hypothetical protein [Deinococcus multiflagellatus]
MASLPTPLDLSDILLDQKNPRLDDTSQRMGQAEVIRDIMSDEILGQQVYKLAQDIVQYGMDPTALLAVTKSADEAEKYIALEGNRRIVALKILTNPDLIVGVGKKSLEKRFRDLSKRFIDEPITEVRCIIFEDEEEADHWIKMRHTGQNDGAGLVEWNALSQGRYTARKGSAPPEVQVLDFVRDHGTLSAEAKENLSNFKITNLQRLLITKDVRDVIGLIQKERVLYTRFPEEEIIKPLQKIIEDLSGKIKVSQLMSKQQRLDYIAGLAPEFMPDHSKASEEEVRLGDVQPSPTAPPTGPEPTEGQAQAGGSTTSNASKSGEANSNSTPNNTPTPGSNATQTTPTTNANNTPTPASGTPPSTGNLTAKELAGIRERNSIIPARYTRTITVSRINELFKELKKLNVTQFPNAGAVMLRVFLELSVDEYMKRHNLVITVRNDKNLNGKIQKCLDHIIGNGQAEHKEMQPVKNFTTDTSSLGSTVTLNAYVHNPLMHPEATSLKITWHNLLPLIERIWP